MSNVAAEGRCTSGTGSFRLVILCADGQNSYEGASFWLAPGQTARVRCYGAYQIVAAKIQGRNQGPGAT